MSEILAQSLLLKHASEAEMYEAYLDLSKLIKSKWRNDRIILTRDKKLELKSEKQLTGKATSEPNGLWYGIGNSWVEWVRREAGEDYADPYVQKISVNISSVLVINSVEDMKKLNEKYGEDPEGSNASIRWDEIAKDYSGIEISPFQSSLRTKADFRWYYSWDMASGCIWDSSAINSSKLVAAFNKETKKFEEV